MRLVRGRSWWPLPRSRRVRWRRVACLRPSIVADARTGRDCDKLMRWAGELAEDGTRGADVERERKVKRNVKQRLKL